MEKKMVRVPIGTPKDAVGEALKGSLGLFSDSMNKTISNGEQSWRVVDGEIWYPINAEWEIREQDLVKVDKEVCYVCGSTELVMPHVLSNSGGRKINLCKGCLP